MWQHSAEMTVAVTLAIATPAAQTPSPAFLIAERKAGPIEIGMSVDEIIERFGRERIRLIDLAKEGLFSPAIEIDIPGASMRGAVVGDIEVHCGLFTVTGITVRDPKFRTADGLGVGSTLGQVRRARSIGVRLEEGISAIVKDEKISFALDKTTDDARVYSVWLYAYAKDVPCRNR